MVCERQTIPICLEKTSACLLKVAVPFKPFWPERLVFVPPACKGLHHWLSDTPRSVS